MVEEVVLVVVGWVQKLLLSQFVQSLQHVQAQELLSQQRVLVGLLTQSVEGLI